MIDNEELIRALQVARQVAGKAGEVLREGRREGFEVSLKGEVDLVTEYDRRSEELVVETLSRAFPDHTVIGEEGTEVTVTDAPFVWYVDPLDGTTNYAHRLPWYSVSIGLEHDGAPVLGVILAPEFGWEFWGRRGEGSFLDDRRLSVSATRTLDGALMATGFPYDRRTSTNNNLSELAAIMSRCQGIRRIGVASLDCAMVAWGVMDAYWEFKLKPWDICAGALLVAEAGGEVSAPDGSPFHSQHGDLVATNGHIHREVIETLAWSKRG